MDPIPTMFSYNALVRRGPEQFEFHYKDKTLTLTIQGSVLTVVGTQHTYKLRPSGLAVLESKENIESKPEPPVQPEPEPAVQPEPEPAVQPEPEPAVQPKPESPVQPKPESPVQPKPESPVDSDSEPKTYYLHATLTRRGLELNTPDFVVFGNAIVSTIPLPRGTKIAVKTVKRTPGFLNVPGIKTLSFAPLEMRAQGNVGKLLVTNSRHGSNPLWSLTGPLKHGFLFYVLTQDTDGPSKCTT